MPLEKRKVASRNTEVFIKAFFTLILSSGSIPSSNVNTSSQPYSSPVSISTETVWFLPSHSLKPFFKLISVKSAFCFNLSEELNTAYRIINLLMRLKVVGCLELYASSKSNKEATYDFSNDSPVSNFSACN